MSIRHTKFLSLVLLGLCLATKMFATHVSHDWSFQVGSTSWQSVGLWGVEEAPGEQVRTYVFYGSGHFSVPLHIYAFTAIANVPVIALGFYAYTGYRRRHNAA